MKKLIKIVAVIVLVLAAIVIGLALYLDTAVKNTVERAGTRALGVETTLEAASLRPLRGSCTISGLRIANPPGYDADLFLGLGSGRVDVTLGSLNKETLDVPVLMLDGVEINLQKREGRANYDVILDNLEKGETEPAPEGEEPGGKTYVIHEVVITDVTATVDMLAAGGLSKITIPLDEVRLQNVGTAGDPVETSELVAIIVKALFAAIAANDQLPREIAANLVSRMAELEDVRGRLSAGGKALDDAGLQDAGKALDDAAKGLGNLLGGQKD